MRLGTAKGTWTACEDAAIRDGRASERPGGQLSFRELSMRLGRTEGAVTARWHRLQELAGVVFAPTLRQVKSVGVPEDVLDECRWRNQLRTERELAGETTAMFCGDPLPGYSALDRPAVAGEAATVVRQPSAVTLASAAVFTAKCG